MSRNWFTYQLVSRFLLASLAGLSLYGLLDRVGIRRRISLPFALFYMTTFSIQYWTMRQGFSSWGAAIMPWCLIPALDFIQKKQINILRLAVSVAVMVQIHMLSAFFLILMYLPFYLYGFVQSKEKWIVVKKGLLAVALSSLLTANIWFALIDVGMGNHLVQPFINSRLYIMTVNQRSVQWILTPLPLLFLVLYQAYFTFRNWRHYNSTLKIVHFSYGIFLVLSTSIFPWYKVVKLNLSVVNLIQFPFRFFVPATVLLLLAMAMVMDTYFYKKWSKAVMLVLAISVLWGGYQVSQMTLAKIDDYYSTSMPIKNQKRQFVLGTEKEIRDSFYSSNLNNLLYHAVKSTPDYLPSDKNNKENKYSLYEEYVFYNINTFSESQKGDKLILTWQASDAGEIQIPVIKYQKTKLVLNGKTLTKNDYSLSAIGTPTVKQKLGDNRLEISYPTGKWFLILLIGNLLLWGLVLVVGTFGYFDKQNK